jgi:hypothetical protein
MGKPTPTIALLDDTCYFLFISLLEDNLLYSIYENTFSSLSRASLIRSIDVA